MDILSLIVACSIHPDGELLRAMIEASSQGNVYFVGDVATLTPYDKSLSRDQAQKILQEIDRHNGKPIVGLLGLPVTWADQHRKSTADLFDGCTNIAIGSALLLRYTQACETALQPRNVADGGAPANEPPTKRSPAQVAALRSCTLDRFGAAIGADGYTDAVTRSLPKPRILYERDRGTKVTTASPPRVVCECLCPTPPRKTTIDSNGATATRPRTEKDRAPLSRAPIDFRYFGPAPIIE